MKELNGAAAHNGCTELVKEFGLFVYMRGTNYIAKVLHLDTLKKVS